MYKCTSNPQLSCGISKKIRQNITERPVDHQQQAEEIAVGCTAGWKALDADLMSKRVAMKKHLLKKILQIPQNVSRIDSAESWDKSNFALEVQFRLFDTYHLRSLMSGIVIQELTFSLRVDCGYILYSLILIKDLDQLSGEKHSF